MRIMYAILMLSLFIFGCAENSSAKTISPVDSLGWQDDPSYSLGEVYEMEVHNSKIYCLDSKAKKVKSFRTDNMSFVKEYGNPGAGPGELSFPLSLALDENRVLVSDIALRKIQIYSFETGEASQQSMDFLINLYSYNSEIYYSTNHLLKDSGIYKFMENGYDEKFLDFSELSRKSQLEDTQFDKLDFAVGADELYVLHKLPGRVFAAKRNREPEEIELEKPDFDFENPLLMKIDAYKDGFILFGRALSKDKKFVNAVFFYKCNGKLQKSWILDIGQQEALFSGTSDAEYFYCWYFNGNLYKFRM